MKCNVDKLDADKLVPVTIDLSKLSEVAKNDLVKKRHIYIYIYIYIMLR